MLRIRLRLRETPELANLPWEYLYDRQESRFLCLWDEALFDRAVMKGHRRRVVAAARLKLRAA